MKYKLILTVLTISAIVFTIDSIVQAAPYSRGTYNANVPYGSQTSLSISTGSAVNLSLSSPSDTGTLASAPSVITVYSTDVVGYKLYIRSLSSTNMVQGSTTIPTSVNGSPAPLAVNTWGFNTDASSNYIGSSLSDIQLKNATGPYTAGNVTTVTYGLKLDNSFPAGAYSTNVMYTAVPQTP